MVHLSEVKIVLRSILISTPVVIDVYQLNKDFNEQEGFEIPYYDFGHKSLIDFLKSIPDVLIISGNSEHSEVTPVSSKKSSHVNDLVLRQKTSSKNSGYSRNLRKTRIINNKLTSVHSPAPQNREPEVISKVEANSGYPLQKSNSDKSNNAKTANTQNRKQPEVISKVETNSGYPRQKSNSDKRTNAKTAYTQNGKQPEVISKVEANSGYPRQKSNSDKSTNAKTANTQNQKQPEVKSKVEANSGYPRQKSNSDKSTNAKTANTQNRKQPEVKSKVEANSGYPRQKSKSDKSTNAKTANTQNQKQPEVKSKVEANSGYPRQKSKSDKSTNAKTANTQNRKQPEVITKVEANSGYPRQKSNSDKSTNAKTANTQNRKQPEVKSKVEANSGYPRQKSKSDKSTNAKTANTQNRKQPEVISKVEANSGYPLQKSNSNESTNVKPPSPANYNSLSCYLTGIKKRLNSLNKDMEVFSKYESYINIMNPGTVVKNTNIQKGNNSSHVKTSLEEENSLDVDIPLRGREKQANKFKCQGSSIKKTYKRNETIENRSGTKNPPEKNIKSKNKRTNRKCHLMKSAVENEPKATDNKNINETYNTIMNNIPRAVQDNLRNLISDFPKGIWCAELPLIYKNYTGEDLSFEAYGYRCLKFLCFDLQHIFHCIQESASDYKLYDKRKPLPEVNWNHIDESENNEFEEVGLNLMEESAIVEKKIKGTVKNQNVPFKNQNIFDIENDEILMSILRQTRMKKSYPI